MESRQVFFGAFNARPLHAEQVASSFVPNKKFWELLDLQNALIVGPRGSGKTTLLKMLQPKALASWNHERANDARASISFVSVFVPADKAWQSQVGSARDRLPESLRERFEAATFVAHVQIAIVSTFLQLLHDRPTIDNGFQALELESAAEAKLVRTLASDWNLDLSIASLFGLRYALTTRLAQMSELPDQSEADVSSYLKRAQTSVMPTVSQAIDLFNSISGRYNQVWALLFDELEIAPLRIQETLFSSLRSSDHRIIFKLAFSPSIKGASMLESWFAPSSNNDFEVIKLYYEKETNFFCEGLWESLVKGTANETLRPSAILGTSYFHEQTENRYEKGGFWSKAFVELADKDESFRRVMLEKSVDPAHLDRASPKLMDAVVRKSAPIVGFRNMLINQGPIAGHGAVLRKGKFSGADLYSGWNALCLVSEGNPRWFTGIAKQLLHERASNPGGKSLSKESQVRILKDASKKFLSYLSATPAKVALSTEKNLKTHTLKELVDKLGSVFRFEVLEREFSLDPVLAFQVDDECETGLVDTVISGLYTGAFVPLDDIELSNPLGSQFRLTYLLAPEIGLPLRRGESRRLLSLLSSEREALRTKGKGRKVANKRRPRPLSGGKQPKLF